MFVCAIHYTYFLLTLHRSSILLTLLALRIVNVCVNSKGHAVLGVNYHGRTTLIFPPCVPLLIKSILGRTKLSMKGR